MPNSPTIASSNVPGSVICNDITIRWTSDAPGNATEVTPPLVGVLTGVQFIPDGGGTQPTDLYDLTLTDPYGYDILRGRGANLSNAASTRVQPTQPATDGTFSGGAAMPISSILTLNVTNAGAAKSGRVILYIR